jgi:urease accessory protein
MGRDRMSTETQSLLLLLNWMSPAFPTGSFAYSHGLEWAIETGDVTSAESAQAWIADLITRGSAWNDAVIFAQCFTDATQDLNALALALAGSAERYLETTQLGRGFAQASAAWMNAEGNDAVIAYPVAAGRACAALGIRREAALVAFLQGFSAAQVSVAVRLVPLGQTAGIHVLRNLAPVIEATANRAGHASLDDLASCTIAAEIAAIKHETQTTRIFRT